MDGVLANFFTAALVKLNEAESPSCFCITEKEYAINVQIFDMAEAFEITPTQFWSTIDTPGFWRKLYPMKWAFTLEDHLRQTGLPVYISSSPSAQAHCIPEKLAWLYRHFNIRETSCMFGSAKHLMAKPGALLIDDRQKNCDKFIEAGGDAVCVPSNWNTYDMSWDTLWKPIKAKLYQ